MTDRLLGAQASASRGNAPRQQAEACAPRSAFTLIELLVVISIFMILMGLTISSVVRGPKLQRMVAAEQMISDVIRQARHTARTSGQPVVLKLKKDEREISGLVRTVLWHGVEGPAQGLRWQVEDEVAVGNYVYDFAPGRTGLGLALPWAYHTSGVFDATRAMWPEAELLGGKRLWRGGAGSDQAKRPGLLLSVAVRPPIAGQVVIAGQSAPEVLPLVLVSDPDRPDIADYDQAPIGLALLLSTIDAPVTAPGPRTTMSTSTVMQKSVPTWEIVGWFGVTGRIEVSSIADRPKDVDQTGQTVIVDQAGTGEGVPIIEITTAANSSSRQFEYGETNAIVGGRWIEISLLVEDNRLVLYRDGRRVGEKTGPVANLPAGLREQVFAGLMTVRSGDPPILASGATVDDLRLERLGEAMSGTLPGGVKIANDRRIVCHPDGRVEIGVDSASRADATIDLTSDSGESARLTVTIEGAVFSEVKP